MNEDVLMHAKGVDKSDFITFWRSGNDVVDVAGKGLLARIACSIEGDRGRGGSGARHDDLMVFETDFRTGCGFSAVACRPGCVAFQPFEVGELAHVSGGCRSCRAVLVFVHNTVAHPFFAGIKGKSDRRVIKGCWRGNRGISFRDGAECAANVEADGCGVLTGC